MTHKEETLWDFPYEMLVPNIEKSSLVYPGRLYSLLNLYGKMQHPVTPKSFPGRLSVLPGNAVLVFNMLNYSRKWAGHCRNDLWHILGSDLRVRKTAYVFILFIGPDYNFRLEIGWEIFKKWNHVKNFAVRHCRLNLGDRPSQGNRCLLTLIFWMEIRVYIWSLFLR